MWKLSKTGASAALEVLDFDVAVPHLKKKRVKFVIGPADGPRWRMVTVRDPDGNQGTCINVKTRRGSKRKGRGARPPQNCSCRACNQLVVERI